MSTVCVKENAAAHGSFLKAVPSGGKCNKEMDSALESILNTAPSELTRRECRCSNEKRG